MFNFRMEWDIDEILKFMIANNQICKISEELYFAKSVIDELQNKLVDFLTTNSQITLGEFKDLTNTSRKFTIPLLEYFDKIKVTKRVGEVRVLR